MQVPKVQENIREKFLVFLDDGIWLGLGKFSVLWRENLSWTFRGLTSRPLISDLTKRDILQLNFSQNNEKVG